MLREFPPRSPDLTPLDFYHWGTFKNMEMRDQIQHAINDISLTAIQTVCRSVRRCCWECTVAEGGHFEHAWQGLRKFKE